jgi:glucose/arabinose dehydrogenase
MMWPSASTLEVPMRSRFVVLLVAANLVVMTGILASQQLPAPSSPGIKFSKVIGWPAGRTPTAPPGFDVAAFAAGLDNPRWLYVLPNGDVLVAEAKTERIAGDVPAELMEGLRTSGMLGKSANRITVLRDADHDGKAEVRQIFLSGLNQPFGMVLLGRAFYVANTDAVMRFEYDTGVTSLSSAGRKVLDLPAGGYNNHWTRNIISNRAGTKLYVSVGSQTNVDEEGLDAKDARRAAILECNPDGTAARVFASGLRNPNGMDWAPDGNTLWTVVNERDMLGDDVPPDYLTSVRAGAFYGWPYSYFGRNEDPRHKGKRPDLVAKAVVPDYPLGAHTASLGLAFYRGTAFPDAYRHGAFVGQRGSWNRSAFSGYKVLFVPFKDGRPVGDAKDFLTGFIANEQTSEVYGRPVGVAVMPDGSLLVADDAGGTVWRVSAGRR